MRRYRLDHSARVGGWHHMGTDAKTLLKPANLQMVWALDCEVTRPLPMSASTPAERRR